MLLSLSSHHVFQTGLNVAWWTASVCSRILRVLRRDVDNGRVNDFRLVNAAVAALLCHDRWRLLLVVLRCLNRSLECLLRHDLGSYMHSGSLKGRLVVSLAVLRDCIEIIFGKLYLERLIHLINRLLLNISLINCGTSWPRCVCFLFSCCFLGLLTIHDLFEIILVLLPEDACPFLTL